MANFEIGTIVRVTEDAIEQCDMPEYGVKVGDLGVVIGIDALKRTMVRIFNDRNPEEPWYLDDNHIEEVKDVQGG